MSEREEATVREWEDDSEWIKRGDSGRCSSTCGEARCWYFAGHPGAIHRDMENNLSWGRAFEDALDDE